MGKIDVKKLASNIKEIKQNIEKYKDFNKVIKASPSEKSLKNWEKIISDYEKNQVYLNL